MKYILIILFLLSTCISFSQTQIIDSIPKEGIVLNKGWQFHAGDDNAGLHHDSTDRTWQNIDPSADVYFLLQIRKAEIGWLRLKLHFDSGLLNQSYSLAISQTCASDIYLNGKLLYRLGIVSKDYKKERTFNSYFRLYSLTLNGQQDQEIDVKFSLNKKNLVITYVRDNPLLRLSLYTPNHVYSSAFSSYNRYILGRDYIVIACYILLAILTGFLLTSYRIQKAYLYFGIYCLGSIVQTILRMPAFNNNNLTVTQISISFLLSHILYLANLIVLLWGMYKIYHAKKGWYYYIILIYALLSIPAFFIIYPLSGLISFCLSPMITVEGLRVLYKPVRQGNLGARILFVTFSLVFLLFVAYIVLLVLQQGELGGNLATIGLFVIPVGMLAFAASEFSITAKALQNKLKEIEILSVEKQQILITQNEVLDQQVTQRTAALNNSLQELKSTQAQLIQSEKMASLGELTAGIAHEIQNPLNFVNNFSEVNKEMIDELQTELNSGNVNEAINISNDIKDNEEKINHHGKRADSIVKGMLQHSRQTKGIKESTDINTLCDEYLRLSYHGLRAKDKEFNAVLTEVGIKTDFDETLGKINIVPQDIGRVLLNLFNNAFYAVNEKQRLMANGYQPTAKVSTKKINDKIEITVSDNGNGIPQNIIDKIFQPFFTTKPTGEGTGLGLSLVYDIITKEHNGTIKVESKEGEGTTFIIQLPIIT